jgi:hypothetical protein
VAPPEKNPRQAHKTFIILILAFGISPLLLRERYSVFSLGWSMFAGGRRAQPTYYLSTPSDSCFALEPSLAIDHIFEKNGRLIFQSKRVQDLMRLKHVFFDLRKCPGTAMFFSRPRVSAALSRSP